MLVNIRAFGRIHVTLIAMNNKGYRLNGGFGFSISDPALTFSISQSDKFQLEDNRDLGVDFNQYQRLGECITSVVEKYNLKKNIRVKISGNLPAHSGFGSGTIIRLSCLEGLFIINKIPYDENLLITYSGRGGTSGIGIRTYFGGGFVFDIGHLNSGQDLLPSSLNENKPKRSLVISQGVMPNWNFGICIPTFAVLPNEAEFFKKNTEVDNNEIYKTLFHVLYGVVGAVIESNQQIFSDAINTLQTCKWKASEISLYGERFLRIKDILSKYGASCIGMSSLGPGIFFMGENIEEIIKLARKEYADAEYFSTCPINSGRELKIEYA